MSASYLGLWWGGGRCSPAIADVIWRIVDIQTMASVPGRLKRLQ